MNYVLITNSQAHCTSGNDETSFIEQVSYLLALFLGSHPTDSQAAVSSSPVKDLSGHTLETATGTGGVASLLGIVRDMGSGIWMG